MSEGYKAVTRLKIDVSPDVYIERGEDVSEGDVENWDQLVESRSVVPANEFAVMFPEVVLGANQAVGTPSNLEQIEGTVLQVNPPAEADEVPALRLPEVNPADVVPVEGAVEPGSGEDSHGQEADEDGLTEENQPNSSGTTPQTQE